MWEMPRVVLPGPVRSSPVRLGQGSVGRGGSPLPPSSQRGAAQWPRDGNIVFWGGRADESLIDMVSGAL